MQRTSGVAGRLLQPHLDAVEACWRAPTAQADLACGKLGIASTAQPLEARPPIGRDGDVDRGAHSAC